MMTDEVQALLQTLESGPSHERPEALTRLCQLLSARRDAEVLGSLLSAALKDPNTLVRILAAEALGDADLLTWHEPLISSLLSDEDATVRACAAESLGDAGNRDAQAALRTALSDDDEVVRCFAAMSLGLVGGLPDAEALRRLGLAKEDIDERVAFISGACRLDAQAQDVEELLRAIDALTDENGFGPLNELEDLFRRAPPVLVRKEASRLRHALDRFETRASAVHHGQLRKLRAFLDSWQRGENEPTP